MIFSLRNKLSIIIICLSITALIILPHQINDGGSSFFGGAQLIPNLTLSLIIILSFVDLVINGFFSFIKKKDHNFLISNGESFEFYDFLAVLLITIAFVTFALALPFLGYLITSFFLSFSKAHPCTFKILIFLKFFSFNPPKAINFLEKCLVSKLNFNVPRLPFLYLFDVSNILDRTI